MARPLSARLRLPAAESTVETGSIGRNRKTSLSWYRWWAAAADRDGLTPGGETLRVPAATITRWITTDI